jgi:hypothetical protein
MGHPLPRTPTRPPTEQPIPRHRIRDAIPRLTPARWAHGLVTKQFWILLLAVPLLAGPILALASPEPANPSTPPTSNPLTAPHHAAPDVDQFDELEPDGRPGSTREQLPATGIDLLAPSLLALCALIIGLTCAGSAQHRSALATGRPTRRRDQGRDLTLAALRELFEQGHS